MATLTEEQPQLTDRQAEVLAVIDSPLPLRDIAEKLGYTGPSHGARYKQINDAARAMVANGVLTFRITVAGHRFYYRTDDRERAIEALFRRYGDAETAAAIVDFAHSTDDFDMQRLLPALRKAIAPLHPRRRRGTARR